MKQFIKYKRIIATVMTLVFLVYYMPQYVAYADTTPASFMVKLLDARDTVITESATDSETKIEFFYVFDVDGGEPPKKIATSDITDATDESNYMYKITVDDEKVASLDNVKLRVKYTVVSDSENNIVAISNDIAMSNSTTEYKAILTLKDQFDWDFDFSDDPNYSESQSGRYITTSYDNPGRTGDLLNYVFHPLVSCDYLQNYRLQYSVGEKSFQNTIGDKIYPSDLNADSGFESVSGEDDNIVKRLKYSEVGKKQIVLSLVDLVKDEENPDQYVEGPCARFLTDKKFIFEVKNSRIGFFADANTENAGEQFTVENVVVDEHTQATRDKIKTVIKTYSEADTTQDAYSLKLNFTEDVYVDSIIYDIEADHIPERKTVGDFFRLSSDGTVTVTDMDLDEEYISCKIVATCKRTSESAEYVLKVFSHESVLSMEKITENSNVTISTDEQLDFEIGNDIGKTFKVVGVIETGYEDKYDISYLADKDTISVDADGTVTIVKANIDDEVATVTITATPKTEYFWLKEVSNTYKVRIDKSTASTKVYVENEQGQEVEWNTLNTITIKDDDSTFTYDSDGVGTSFKLPFYVKAYDAANNEITCTAQVVGIGNADLTFSDLDKYTITNPDTISRNQVFAYKVTLTPVGADDITNYNIDEVYVNMLVKGTQQSSEYYDISTGDIVVGADGNRWAVNANVTFTIKSALAASMHFSGNSQTHTIYCTEPTENADNEHTLYVCKNERTITQREYFGVDTAEPTIDWFIFSGNAVVCPQSVYAKDSVSLSVQVSDIEKRRDNAEEMSFGHLYRVELLNGTTVIATKEENEITNKKCQVLTFTIDKNTYANQELDLKIRVTDRANRVVTKSLCDIKTDDTLEANSFLIDTSAPNISNTIEKGSEVQYRNVAGKNIYSGNVIINIDIDDESSNNTSTGVKKYDVAINGQYSSTYSKDYANPVDNDSFSISTNGRVTADGSVTVEVVAYDLAGNESQRKTVRIYIDKDAPDIVFDSIVTDGNKNHYNIGNYFNKSTKLIVKCHDNLTSVSSATLNIGGQSINGSISDNTVTFNIPVGVKGDASISVKDIFGNGKSFNLTEIKNESDNYVFESNYIHIDDKSVNISASVDRKPDSGSKWYNKEVTFAISASENTANPSGIREIHCYVNDVEISDALKQYNTREKNSVNLNVVIDNEKISSLVNGEGSYELHVVATDNAGNIGTVSKKIYIDKVAPIISNVSGARNDSFNTGTVTIFANVSEKHFYEDGFKVYAEVTRKLDNETSIYTVESTKFVSDNSRVQFAFAEDGTYNVTVVAVDAAGNKTTYPAMTFVIDNTSPLCSVSGVADNAYCVDNAVVSISVIESNYENCKINIHATRTLNGQSYDIVDDNHMSANKIETFTKSFNEEGEYVVTVDAIDAAGNVSATQNIHFTVDTGKPMVSISNVKENTAYANGVTPVISFIDNYYDSYKLKLVKTGVYFGSDVTFTSNMKNTDVTNLVTKTIDLNSKGGTITINQFPNEQKYDGVYTLSVWVTDKAGRETETSVTFSINRYGSVFSLDNNLFVLNNTVVSEVDDDFVIREFNASEVLMDSIKVDITRDGTPIIDANVDIKKVASKTNSDTGWYEYTYKIDKSNFLLDGIYVIEVTSTDEAGNRSQSLNYDGLKIEFAVDRTKPDIVFVSGLEEVSYKAEKITVNYEVFDAIGLGEVRIYVNNLAIQKISEFDDVTNYKGSVMIGEGTNQKIRIEVTDLAGNTINSDNLADVQSGKVADFNREVTVSTNFFVIWYSNRFWFYITIGGFVVLVGALGTLHFMKRKNKK